MLLRRLYFTYKRDVLNYHHKVLQESSISTNLIPEAYLSSASQGNFLEVLNMALNGKYYSFMCILHNTFYNKYNFI